MRRTNNRRLRRDIDWDGTGYSVTKAFDFADLSVSGANVAASLTTNASAITTEKNRLDTLIDSGSTLDTISELKTAWEASDSSLSGTVNTLVATATADRAAIRTEVNALKPVRVYYVDSNRSDAYTETGSFKSPLDA